MPKAGELVRASDYSRAASVQEAADSAAITTTETVVGTLTFTAVNGATYETRWHIKYVQSVAADRFLVSIREDNVSGTVLDTWLITPPGVNLTGLQQSFYLDFTAAASGAKSLVVTMVRSSGTGNIYRAAKSSYQIYRVA